MSGAAITCSLLAWNVVYSDPPIYSFSQSDIVNYKELLTTHEASSGGLIWYIVSPVFLVLYLILGSIAHRYLETIQARMVGVWVVPFLALVPIAFGIITGYLAFVAYSDTGRGEILTPLGSIANDGHCYYLTLGERYYTDPYSSEFRYYIHDCELDGTNCSGQELVTYPGYYDSDRLATAILWIDDEQMLTVLIDNEVVYSQAVGD